MYGFKKGAHLDFVINLIQECFLHGWYKSLILEHTLTPTEFYQHASNKLITCIFSMPDHVANKLQSRNNCHLFHHEKFFIFIGTQISAVIEILIAKILLGQDLDLTFLAQNVGHCCLNGKTEYIFQPLLPLLIVKTRNCYIWQRFVQKLFLKFPDQSLDKILLHIFKYTPSIYCVPHMLGDIVLKRTKAKFVILHKLLLTYSSLDCIVAKNVIGYLGCNDSTFHLVSETLLKLLNVWSSTSSIKHTPYEQHRYITVVILTCAAFLNETSLQSRLKSDITIGFMEGVKNHIESPDKKMRTLGMIVAEKLADLVKFDSQKERLTFEYENTEDTNLLLSLSSLPTKPDDNFYSEQMELFRKTQSDIDCITITSPIEVSYGVGKSKFVKMAQSQQLKLLPKKEDEKSSLIDESEDDVDSDDDLIPYDIPEEKPFSKVATPMYIRDCMDGLIENKDRDHMEIYLTHVAELIKSDEFATKEVSVELCTILLNLQDNYAIEDFQSIRRNAIVAILLCDPKPVARYITDEFYSEHYNLQQRVDMLDILVMAAGKLSGLNKENKKQDTEITEEVSMDQKEISWKEVVERRIESKTRRFGKIKKLQQSSPDRFGPVAGYFFFPLMAGYDRRIRTLDLLGTDSMVLGRLLYALGTILYSTGYSMAAEDMALSLLQFIAQLRHHVEAFVRKACMYCVTMVTLSVRSLTERLNDDALDARDWLCDVIEHDDDSQARELASNAMVLMSKKVYDEMKLKDS